MDVRQDRYYVGDNAGRHADSMAGHTAACSLGIGGLVLLFIFLIIIARAVHCGHERTRDTIGHGNALLLASRQDIQALAVAFACNEGRQDVVTAAILARVDANGERLCGLARQSDDNAFRVINHGETWGFQSFRREPCCAGVTMAVGAMAPPLTSAAASRLLPPLAQCLAVEIRAQEHKHEPRDINRGHESARGRKAAGSSSQNPTWYT